MKITFNNHHNNNDAKKQKSKQIEINRNCVITNYNPDENRNPQGAGALTLSVQEGENGSNGSVEYKKGKSIFNGDVKLNQTKYSVFTTIASADKNDKSGNELTLDDLEALEDICDKKGNLKDKVHNKYLNGILQQLKSLGIAIKVDFSKLKEGKVLIHIGQDEILCIDFETDKEKTARLKSRPAARTTAATDTGRSQTSSTSQSAKPKTAQQTQTQTAAANTYKPRKSNEPQKMVKRSQISESKLKQMDRYMADCISHFSGGGIPISEVHDMASVARYTGLSESYIRDVLVGLEAHNSWPETLAYDDLVPGGKTEFDTKLEKDLKNNHPKKYQQYVAKNQQINRERAAKNKKPEPLWVTIRREMGYCIGTITIGFGHTSLIGEPYLEAGMQVTEQQAYQLLANDILKAKKAAMRKLDKYISEIDGKPLFSGAKKSIKDAIVDLVYNKGPGAINESLIRNLQKGYVHSAARRTWYGTGNRGLVKRNIYRFIAAVRDLDTKLRANQTVSDAENAIKNFRNEHLTHIQKAEPKVRRAWNDMCDSKKLPQYKVSV